MAPQRPKRPALARVHAHLRLLLSNASLRSWANGRKKKTYDLIKRWNIVRGDKVIVVNGKHSGQTGTVQHVLRAKNRIIADGVNMGTRMLYDKRDPQRLPRPTNAPRSIHYSNVNLICPMTNLPTRIRRAFLEDGTRIRIAVRSGATIPYPKWERRTPRKTVIGEKDTPEHDVLEVTYEPDRDCKLWETTLVDGVRQLNLYDS